VKSPWRKSSRSGGQGNCVEARLNGTPEIRDSKMGDASPVLELSRDAFVALLNNVKLGNGLSQRSALPAADRCLVCGCLSALWPGIGILGAGVMQRFWLAWSRWRF